MTAMKRWWGMVLLAGPLACSAQAEPDYRGEPLAVLRGAVITGEQSAPSDIEAALVWITGPPDEEGSPIARVRVRGQFPAQFTIEVFDPPPPPASWIPRRSPAQNWPDDWEPDPTSVGILAAIAPNSGDRISYDEILGVWLGGGVQYFARDANGADNDLVLTEAERRKVPPTRGYHLYRQSVDEPSEAQYFRCQYRDFCQRAIVTSTPGQDLPDVPGTTRFVADLQVFNDAEYAKCLKYLDQPTTCTSYYPEGRTAEEQAENERCSELQIQIFERAQSAAESPPDCGIPWQYVENPDEFAHAVNIELGTNELDWMNPRYRE